MTMRGWLALGWKGMTTTIRLPRKIAQTTILLAKP